MSSACPPPPQRAGFGCRASQTSGNQQPQSYPHDRSKGAFLEIASPEPFPGASWSSTLSPPPPISCAAADGGGDARSDCPSACAIQPSRCCGNMLLLLLPSYPPVLDACLRYLTPLRVWHHALSAQQMLPVPALDRRDLYRSPSPCSADRHLSVPSCLYCLPVPAPSVASIATPIPRFSSPSLAAHKDVPTLVLRHPGSDRPARCRSLASTAGCQQLTAEELAGSVRQVGCTNFADMVVSNEQMQQRIADADPHDFVDLSAHLRGQPAAADRLRRTASSGPRGAAVASKRAIPQGCPSSATTPRSNRTSPPASGSRGWRTRGWRTSAAIPARPPSTRAPTAMLTSPSVAERRSSSTSTPSKNSMLLRTGTNREKRETAIINSR